MPIPNMLDRVARIWAYGSYITDSTDLGDIDLVADLERKQSDYKAYEKANAARAKAAIEAGRTLSYRQELTFAEHEVRTRLRGNSPYLSLIFDKSSVDRLGCPIKLIYPRPADVPAFPA
jgi:hypothetical protein